jgi:membrane fusion protein (multidrug efflux system)
MNLARHMISRTGVKAMTRPNRRFLVQLSLILLLALALGDQALGQPGPGQMPPFAVGVMEVALVDFPTRAQYPAVIEGRAKVEVLAEVTGRVHNRAFEEGEWVEKDQILFEIDVQASGAKVSQGEATVSEAQARLNFAEAQLSRQKILMDKGVSAKLDYENAVRDRDMALANLNSAQAALEQIRQEAALTIIKAPISGYVGAPEKTAGDLVAPGSAEMALMTTIEDMSSVKVSYNIPETHVSRYQAMAMEFGVDLEALSDIAATLFISGQAYPYAGRMEYGSGRIERGSGVMAAQAAFPNPDRELFSGEVARVTLEMMTLKGVLAIPQAAIVFGQPLAVAVVGPDQTIEFRPIAPRGPYNGFFILKNDGVLAPGEKIVVEGLSKIRPGQPVKARLIQTEAKF